MRGWIAGSIAGASLTFAAGAGAVAGGSAIQAHTGDQIVINKNLRCLVDRPTSIVCGGAAGAHVSAEVSANGQIVILAQPTPHGIYPVLYIDRALCGTSPCRLVVRSR
jgi:hypothetical protein